MTWRAAIDGPTLSLVPLQTDAAHDLLDGGDGSLQALRGWPHADTLDAVWAGVANGDPDALPWLIVVHAGEEQGVVGDLGCKGGPGPDGDIEIGYGVAAPYRGRGYATEAVGLLAHWLETQGVRRIWAEVLLDNAPSRAVLDRLGFAVDRIDGAYAWYVRSVVN